MFPWHPAFHNPRLPNSGPGVVHGKEIAVGRHSMHSLGKQAGRIALFLSATWDTVQDSMGEWYVTQPWKEKEILEKHHAGYSLESSALGMTQ